MININYLEKVARSKYKDFIDQYLQDNNVQLNPDFTNNGKGPGINKRSPEYIKYLGEQYHGKNKIYKEFIQGINRKSPEHAASSKAEAKIHRALGYDHDNRIAREKGRNSYINTSILKQEAKKSLEELDKIKKSNAGKKFGITRFLAWEDAQDAYQAKREAQAQARAEQQAANTSVRPGGGSAGGFGRASSHGSKTKLPKMPKQSPVFNLIKNNPKTSMAIAGGLGAAGLGSMVLNKYNEMNQFQNLY